MLIRLFLVIIIYVLAIITQLIWAQTPLRFENNVLVSMIINIDRTHVEMWKTIYNTTLIFLPLFVLSCFTHIALTIVNCIYLFGMLCYFSVLIWVNALLKGSELIYIFLLLEILFIFVAIYAFILLNVLDAKKKQTLHEE